VYGKPVGHSSTVQSKPPTTTARHYYRAQCRCGHVGAWKVYRASAEVDAQQHIQAVSSGIVA
jgi:hypothetical protein